MHAKKVTIVIEFDDGERLEKSLQPADVALELQNEFDDVTSRDGWRRFAPNGRGTLKLTADGTWSRP